MLCHLQVYAVIVVAVRIDIKIVRPHIAAHKEVDGPEWAFTYMEPVQLDVDASVEVYQRRTHPDSGSLHVAVLYRHSG